MAAETKRSVAGDPATTGPAPVSLLGMLSGGLGAGLLVCAVLVGRQPRFTLSFVDAGFWGLVVALGAIRYLDLRRSAAARNEGSPAGQWRHFALRLVVVATLVWTGCQCLQA
ncbi:MAG: hypothetical protein HY744_17600 [Deltaproteobacteria bacterium]|nr:hypothetical protein [Deltaproteobacteria bacterium]